MTTFSLRYDMRAPAFGADAQLLYAAALEQVEWAERNGFSAVGVSEHHGTDDGYCSSPFVLGAALAARTQTMRIRFTVAVPTLHHPLKVAEDVATVDLVSGGRVDLVLGCGYRRAEYDMFGQPFDGRGARLEEYCETLRCAWTGEPFDIQGTAVRVTPRPVQRHGPPLLLGGASPASARRAARVADGYLPVTSELWDLYRNVCEAAGRDPGPRPPRSNSPGFLYVTDDPEAAWAKIAPHAMHETNSYGRWLREDETGEARPYESVEDPDLLRATEMYRIVTPEECIALAHDLDDLSFHPLMGGLPPELSWASLELAAARVLPALADAGEQATSVSETRA